MTDGYGADHDPENCPECAAANRLGRRGFLGMVGVGILSAVAGFETTRQIDAGAPASMEAARAATVSGVTTSEFLRPGETGGSSTTAEPKVVLGVIPEPHPGPPVTISQALVPTPRIAITVDDGFCATCAEAYVEFARNTGLPITFSPNGVYSAIWDPMAGSLQPLIARGQVQIGNHTYTHANLLTLSESAIEDELERNDEWIRNQFGITSRPWFRPPYGLHDDRTDDIAGSLGFTHVLMWNGSFGDSTPITPSQILALAREYLRPGVVMLGHANYPTIVPLLPDIYDMITERGLDPVTLDEMFGTSRNTG